jgi:hypothetical protein
MAVADPSIINNKMVYELGQEMYASYLYLLRLESVIIRYHLQKKL